MQRVRRRRHQAHGLASRRARAQRTPPPPPPPSGAPKIGWFLSILALLALLALVGAALEVRLALDRRRLRKRTPPAPLPPTPEELDLQQRAIESLARSAWLPVVDQSEGKPADSRFGGRPALLPGEPWPRCGKCREPMHFFAQIDLATAPKPRPIHGPAALVAPRDGLLQLFHCTGIDCYQGDEPTTATCSLARLIPPAALGSLVLGRGGDRLPPKARRALDGAARLSHGRPRRRIGRVRHARRHE